MIFRGLFFLFNFDFTFGVKETVLRTSFRHRILTKACHLRYTAAYGNSTSCRGNNSFLSFNSLNLCGSSEPVSGSHSIIKQTKIY